MVWTARHSSPVSRCEGQAAGEIDRSLRTDALVLSLIAVHDGNMLLWFRSGFDSATGRMLASAFSRLLIEKSSRGTAGAPPHALRW